MYDVRNYNFKNILKEYRKSRNFTLEELGNKIGKTKATISKYENGEIIPDILTILEICNILDINISQLFPVDKVSTDYSISNPFNVNKLYLYYYTENVLITSIIEIFDENNKISVKLFNGVKNTLYYAQNTSYFYEGLLETDKTIGYLNLSNSSAPNIPLEKLQISFNIPWTNIFEITNCFILGLSPNAVPIVKKGIISIYPINDFQPFYNDLKITKFELDKLQYNNGWILENKNYNHFFFDKTS